MQATIEFVNLMRSGNPHLAIAVAKRERDSADSCLRYYLWSVRWENANRALFEAVEAAR
jgi:hypothetical protein